MIIRRFQGYLRRNRVLQAHLSDLNYYFTQSHRRLKMTRMSLSSFLYAMGDYVVCPLPPLAGNRI